MIIIDSSNNTNTNNNNSNNNNNNNNNNNQNEPNLKNYRYQKTRIATLWIKKKVS